MQNAAFAKDGLVPPERLKALQVRSDGPGLPIVFARFGWALFAALNPFEVAWARVLPFVRPERRRRVAWEARLLVLIHGGTMATAVTFMPELWRLYLGVLVGHMLLSLYITAEHRGLSSNGTIFERTRSLKVPAWVRWLLWNMPYHAEHHAWPAVPFHALPALHKEVRKHLVHHESLFRLHLNGGRPSGERTPVAPPTDN